MSRTLFPKISVYQQEYLDVNNNHQLYLEQSGNPDGIAVLYLHGGPGSGCCENHRRYFDPDKYRIILFDQRGCGRSKPSPSIIDNTSSELINDVELIRQHLGVKQWLVAGGGWGGTLALLYGISHPDRVNGFILRGTFLATSSELDWLYKPRGVQYFYPEYYKNFINHLPETNRDNPLLGYYQLLTSDNEVAVISASKAWALWEIRLSSIEQNNIGIAQVRDAHQALCMAKISSHFFSQNCFIEENYIQKNITKIADIPAIFIHGRYDMVCQLYNINVLVDAWQNSQLQILPGAGHSGFESQTIDAFCKATDIMAQFLKERESNK